MYAQRSRNKLENEGKNEFIIDEFLGSKHSTVDITKIKVSSKLWPRESLNKESITRYMEYYEKGEGLPPITINKQKMLVDGRHRLEALKKIGRKAAQAQIIDLPETEIYKKAILSNRKHGTPFTKGDRDEQIWTLRHEMELTLKETADLVGLSESGVSRIYNKQLRLRNLSSQDSKDQRKKVDTKEIIERINQGSKQIDIAKDFGISVSRVSQIKSGLNDKQIIILMEGKPLILLFNRLFQGIKGLAEFVFYQDFLFTSIRDEKISKVNCYSKDYFPHYNIEKEFTWTTSHAILEPFKFLSKYSGDTVKMMLNVSKKGTNISFHSENFGSYQNNGDTEFYSETPALPNALNKLDGKGKLLNSSSTVTFTSKPLEGLPKSEKYHLTLGEKLIVEGISIKGWKFRKEIPTSDFSGEPINVTVDGDFKEYINHRLNEKYTFCIEKKSNLLLINTHEDRCWSTLVMSLLDNY